MSNIKYYGFFCEYEGIIQNRSSRELPDGLPESVQEIIGRVIDMLYSGMCIRSPKVKLSVPVRLSHDSEETGTLKLAFMSLLSPKYAGYYNDNDDVIAKDDGILVLEECDGVLEFAEPVYGDMRLEIVPGETLEAWALRQADEQQPVLADKPF